MPHAIDAWHQEHMYFNRLLRLLHREVDAFHAGEVPNYLLMLDIISYLQEYGDLQHHPREDEAFARLAKRCPDRELPIARLKQEHRVIANAGESLRHLLEEAADDAILLRAEVEMAAATYLVYYGNHIQREEEDILPKAAEYLTEADWAAIRGAVKTREDPVFGSGPHERFRELRRRIAMED